MQALAEPLGIELGGSVVRLQRNQNFTVAHAYGRTIAESQVEARVRKAYVVQNGIQFAGCDDAAYLIFDVGEDHLRGFDARTCRSARVQPDLTRIDRWKEIAAHQKYQAKRSERKHQESRKDGGTVIQSPIQQSGVSGPKFYETSIEREVNAPNEGMTFCRSSLAVLAFSIHVHFLF